MKLILKIMSVLLSLVMLTTALSAGFYGLADDADINKLVKALEDKNDFVRTLTNYSETSESEGWVDEANYVGYAKTVTAKDDAERSIATATELLYKMVDKHVSATYDEGNYTLPLVYEYIDNVLKEKMDDENKLIRVDTNGDRYVPVARVTTNERDVYVDYNSTEKLNAVCIDEEGTLGVSYDTLDWWTSDTELCMVDEDGKIYARNPHELGREVTVDESTGYEEIVVYITATSVDNPKAMTRIRVHIRHLAEVVDGVDVNLNASLTDIPEALVVHQAENTYDEDGNVVVEGFAPELYATHYEFYNVSRVIHYMLGDCNTVSSSNWFYTYEFTVATDFETAFLSIAEGSNVQFFQNGCEVDIFTETYSWPSHVRTYDESGTMARYALDSSFYTHTSSKTVDDTSVQSLYDLYYFFCEPGESAPIHFDYSTWSNEYCEQYVKENDVDKKVSVLKNFSNEFLAEFFGKSIYTIMATYNMMRPNYTYTELWADGGKDMDHGLTYNVKSGASESENVNQKYYLFRNVRTNSDGTIADYWVSTEDLDNIIKSIDSLLTNASLVDILEIFLSTSSSLFAGTGVEGASFTNAKELLQTLIAAKLYSDDIVNLVIDKLYPVLGNIYNLATTIVPEATADIGEGLRDLGFYFRTPKDPLNMWADTYKTEFPEVVTFLQNNSWHKDEDGEIDGLTNSVDDCHWNINGSKEKFIDALCAALSPLGYVLLGICKADTDDCIEGSVTALLLVNFSLKIYSANLYGGLLVPLLEALGIGADDGLMTSTAFESACNKDNHGADDGPYQSLALRYILTPLLNWVENKVLEKPIETVCALLPNLSYFIQSGNLKTAAQNVKVRVTVAGIDASFVAKLWSGLEDYVGPFEDDYFNIWGLLSEGALKDTKVGDAEIWKLCDPTSEIKLGTGETEHTIKGGCINAVIQALLADTFSAKKITGTDEFGYVYEKDYDSPLLDESGNQIYYEELVLDEETGQYVSQSVAQYEDKKYSVPLPTLCDTKLQNAGTSVAYKSLNGLDSSKLVCDHPGLVLLFLLRYVFYGINYTAYNADWSNPSLLNCFIDDDQFYGELFLGISISDLVSNIVLNPDEAVCALVELFISNETYTHGSDVHDTAWENYYSLEYPDYLVEDVAGKESFGAPVRYTQYWTREYADEVVTDFVPLIDNVLTMLKLDSLSFEIMGNTYSLENGINAFLVDLVSGIAYQNDILSMLGSTIYDLLFGLSGDIPIDTILDVALNISFDTESCLETLHYKTVSERCASLGIDEKVSYKSEVEKALQEYQDSLDPDKSLDDVFYKTVEVVGEDGEVTTEQVARDWGLEDTTIFSGSDSILKWERDDLFISCLVSLLAPAAELLKILLLGKDLSVLGIVTLDMYEIYYYFIIPLFETLGAYDISSYESMAKRSKDDTPLSVVVENIDEADSAHIGNTLTVSASEYSSIDWNKYELVEASKVTVGNLHVLEDFVAPIKGLIDVIIEDPVSWIFETIPKLMYFLLSGAFNDAVNNLLHFAYVLLDILRPIVDAYDIVDNVLAGLDLSEYGINLSLPIDLDVNGIVNSLLGDYMSGIAFSFEVLGADLAITLPELDLTMLCTGKPNEKLSVSGNMIIDLSESGDGKGDLLTVILQYALETLFLDSNWENICAWVSASQELDGFDTETVYTLLTDLNVMFDEQQAPDKVLYVLYILISKLTSVSGTLASRFKNVEFGLLDLFNFDSGLEGFIDRIKALLSASDEEPTPTAQAATGFIAKLTEFFNKIKAFFSGLFSIFKIA